MTDTTLFGKIIRREIPADIILETDELLAFRDINPQAPTHVLIIPKEPIRTINDIQNEHTELMGKLFLAAANLRNANTLNLPSHPSHSPHRQIDFILHSPGIQITNFYIPDVRLSDHSPLICDFTIGGGNGIA